MKTVLLTGATGFIGSYVLPRLISSNYDVYAVSGKTVLPAGVKKVKLDLSDRKETHAVLKEIRPEICLNLAWPALQGYQTSPESLLFTKACANLTKAFIENGGRFFIGTGTCVEYSFKNMPLKETDSLEPLSDYAAAKNEIRLFTEKMCAQSGISFAWGRIFYAYGKNESPRRLLPSIVAGLRNNTPVTIKTSHLIKDYLYAKDIAGAFLKILDSGFQGTVNICSSRPVSVGEFARTVARKMGKEHLLVLQENPSAEPPFIVGDNSRLTKELGYDIHYFLETALEEILYD